MKMLHPFMPFVTETIWQSLPHHGETIVKANWPTVDQALIFNESKQTMEQLVEIIKSVNQELKLTHRYLKAIPILIQTKDEKIKHTLMDNISYLPKFCNPSQLTIDTEIEIQKKL